MSRSRSRSWLAVASLALCGVLAAAKAQPATVPTLPERDRVLLERAVAALRPQQPDRTDLYVVGLAGDGHEDVFRNEVAYLAMLMAQRFGADRTVSLVNHADSLDAAPAPLATLDNLRWILARLGERMDRTQDVLLLFLASHGSPDHDFALQLYPVVDAAIRPGELRAALDDAGIRHRIVVVSACFAGGFAPALYGPDTLVIAAARHDRASFGCGADAEATYFGRAWLVDGLNRAGNFIAAYDVATRRIAERERDGDHEPSLPQIVVGERIARRIHAWQAGVVPGAAVPYPFAPEADPDAGDSAP